MLIHPTLDKLKALRFTGMARALEEQMNMPQISDLTFEDRLGLMIDREPSSQQQTQKGQAQATSLHRGHRLPPSTRSGQIPHGTPRHLHLHLRAP
jgi:hypothetical protein